MSRYRLGKFVLHLDAQPALRNAENRAVVSMPDSCMRILVALVTAGNKGRNTHYLLRHCWDDEVLPSSLHRAIENLRNALGREREWIQNRKDPSGDTSVYRFVGPVQRLGTSPLELRLQAVSAVTRDPEVAMAGEQRLTCRIGGSWSLLCQPSDDCYLTIFLEGTSTRLYRLYLDATSPHCFARGGTTYRIPPKSGELWFRENGPAGTETVWAFATREPLDGDPRRAEASGYIRAATVGELQAVRETMRTIERADQARAECTVIVVP